MGVSPRKTRSDITPKSQPSKAKQKNEEYLKYRAYIRSKQFKEVKKIVEERCGGRCQFCDRSRADGVTLSVHHKTYKHLFQGGEIEANDCILICSREHKLLHSMKCNYKWFSRNNERNKNEGGDTNQDIAT